MQNCSRNAGRQAFPYPGPTEFVGTRLNYDLVGTKYVRRFKDIVQKRETEFMRQNRISIVSSYNNVILWRHQFAHEGQVPTSATYEEVVESYQVGKEVINCLARSMRR